MLPTVTVSVSPGASVALPWIIGVVLLVICDTTVGTAGGTVSTINSSTVASSEEFPAVSITLAVTE